MPSGYLSEQRSKKKKDKIILKKVFRKYYRGESYTVKQKVL